MKYIPTFTKSSKFDENYYDFIKALGIELEKERLIDKYDQSKWMYIFSGLDNFLGDDQFTWLGDKNHCVYLIDELVSRDIIKGKNINSKIERYFLIKNVAQTRYSYEPRKPDGFKVIDQLILRALNSL
jgi:hypothetical protein|tara:strand:- start:219 stop:602 length:384 start_codon:yes stop_codon:yes gene_type:complete